MSEFYDKDKFAGNESQRPTPPTSPHKRDTKPEGNMSWLMWPAIIVLFSIGAWPIALALLFYNIFRDDKGQKKGGASRKEVSIDDAVERAMAKAEEKMGKERMSAVEESLRKARAAANSGANQARTAAGSVEEQIRAAAEDMQRHIYTQTADKKDKNKGKKKDKKAEKIEKNTKPYKKKKMKLPGKALRVLGIIFLSIGGILGLTFMSQLFEGWAEIDLFFTALGFLFPGGFMLGRGNNLANNARRSQRYIMAIGNADAMPIREIAKRVNRTPEKAEKEMQKLIDKGYLGEDAYIDHERGYFLRFGVTLEDEEEVEPQREAPPPPPRETQEGYSGILRNIRRANDRIADDELSRKIDRLEQVSGLIFKEVEEHPEKKERIHTFFDYYLPTTQKLLDTYADFEETGVEGDNLREAKVRIEQIMDAVVEGFEHQLDQLYSDDAMDVVSDIHVMETMLSRDLASVAKDFGIDTSQSTNKSSKKKNDAADGGGQQLQF